MCYALTQIFILSFLLNAISVYGSLYVINPASGSTCHGSQPCTVQWLDDGIAPLLSNVGVCTVGLYTGHEKLVQTITAVDVSSTHSLEFTPDPKAGPNSDAYYIAFTSTTLRAENGSGFYQEFSPFFRLDRMTGSFASPVPSDTSSKPIPSTVAYRSTNAITSTSIVGQLSTSGFSTVTSSVSTSTSTTRAPSPSGAAGGSSTSNSASRVLPIPSSLFVLSVGFVLVTPLGYL